MVTQNDVEKHFYGHKLKHTHIQNESKENIDVKKEEFKIIEKTEKYWAEQK